MNAFRYCLIRYIADRNRMEPINVGLILQGTDRIDFKLHPHIAKRKEIDTAVFQQWREFLTEEIRGTPATLFQPERHSVQFLRYLASACEQGHGTVMISRPLLVSQDRRVGFEVVFSSLFRQLVLPPDLTSPLESTLPTGRFRQISDERNFQKRGLKRKAPIPLPGYATLFPYRQAKNGRVIAIDKVEVRAQVETTTNEVERLSAVIDALAAFLNVGGQSHGNEYYLLADDLAVPFGNQSAADFDALKTEFDSKVEKISRIGGQVLRTTSDAEQLANTIDVVLPPLSSNSQFN